MIRYTLPLLLIVALAGCGRSDDAPGGVTRGEQKALDDAAEMIDKQQLNPSVIPPAPAQSVAQSPVPAASDQSN